ncbi:MAG: potassium-transporting ATPase subunit C, partial [Nostoc sp.]
MTSELTSCVGLISLLFDFTKKAYAVTAIKIAVRLSSTVCSQVISSRFGDVPMSFAREASRAVRSTLVLWVITAIIYPFAMIAIGQTAFPFQANGSLL